MSGSRCQVSSFRCQGFSLTLALSRKERGQDEGKKREPLEATLYVIKCRNDHSEEVLGEESFAVGMSVHWAEFYADSGRCQGVFQVSSFRFQVSGEGMV